MSLVIPYDVGMVRDLAAFAEWVYRFRLALGLTQKEFADRLHTTQATISRWESGERGPSTFALVVLRNMARRHGYDPPPEAGLRLGPKIRKEE